MLAGPLRALGVLQVQGSSAERGVVLGMCPPEDGTGGTGTAGQTCAGEGRAQGPVSLLLVGTLQEKFASVHHGQQEVFVRAD